LEKQEIISLIVVVILAIPAIIFLYLGFLKLVDFALVYAYTSAAVIVIVLAWGFRHRIERAFIKSKSEATSKPESNDGNVRKTPNEIFEDLLQELENFTNKWDYPSGFVVGYRKQIETNSIRGDTKEIKKIIRHHSNIYDKINLVKQLGVATINNKLDEMMPSVANLVGFGEDIKAIYSSSKRSKTMLASDPQLKNNLLSHGDKICDQFDEAVYQLRLLRKDLPLN
jgi:hypothetical protein